MRTFVDRPGNSLGVKERCLGCGVDHNPASTAFILRAVENPKRMSARACFFESPTETFREFNRLSNMLVWMGTHLTIIVRIGRNIKFTSVNGDLLRYRFRRCVVCLQLLLLRPFPAGVGDSPEVDFDLKVVAYYPSYRSYTGHTSFTR